MGEMAKLHGHLLPSTGKKIAWLVQSKTMYVIEA